MNTKYDGANMILSGAEDFDLRQIFDCGQCFRFNALPEGGYLGVAFGRALRTEQLQNGDVIFYDTSPEEFYGVWYDFFDMGTDYGAIKRRLSENDDVMKGAAEYGGGIRILRQELWETVVSFIISQSNNIPRIKGIIERLCDNFGDEIFYGGKIYRAFPSPEVLSALSLGDISVIRAGFRDKYILGAARLFADGTISGEKLRSLNDSDAKRLLMSVKGIGNKVADCVMLFGLGRTAAFPIDVWIKRITEERYFGSEQSVKTLAAFAEEKFGDLGGYAQQYLFFYAREDGGQRCLLT